MQLYASGYGYGTTARKLAEEFGIEPPVRPQSIRSLVQKPKNLLKVNQYREIYSRTLEGIAIADKHYRLRVLDEELRKARHDRFVGETRDGNPIYKRDTGGIVAICRLAAEETGGLKGLTDGNQPIQVVVGINLNYPGPAIATSGRVITQG